MAKNKESEKEEVTFFKDQLVQSKRFVRSRDALNVLLENGKKYTISQVETLLADFMKGKVN